MDEILGDIAKLGGVVGAYVLDGAGTILAAQPEELGRSPEHAEAGRAAMRAFTSLASLGEGFPDEIDFSFEKGRVVFRSAGPGASLAIVCQPSINALMLRLKTAIAVTAIAERLEAWRRQKASLRLNARVKEALVASLGERGAKFVALATAAGESPEKLAAASSEAIRFAKMFLGKEKAEALANHLRFVLGRDV